MALAQAAPNILRLCQFLVSEPRLIAMGDRLKVTVLKGLAATSELLQVEVERESLVFELMLLLHKEIKLHWRRQRILCDGLPVDEADRWSQITRESSIDVQMLHCDHRHVNPIDDRTKLLAMVRCCGEALSYASPELKQDKDLVRIAVATTGESLHFAHKSLQKDRELVELGMSTNPNVFRIAGKMLRKEPDLAKRAIDADIDLIRYCDPDLLQNLEFMKYCVQKRASLLRYSKARLDRKIYLAALERDGLVLEFLAEKALRGFRSRRGDVERCDDEEFVRAAVRQNGMALAFASERHREDVQCVLEAVRNDERAMKFVRSKPVICQVVKERPSALKHALWEFHDDLEVVEVAYASDPTSLKFAGTEAALGMIMEHGPKVLRFLKTSIQQDERVRHAISISEAEDLGEDTATECTWKIWKQHDVDSC